MPDSLILRITNPYPYVVDLTDKRVHLVVLLTEKRSGGLLAIDTLQDGPGKIAPRSVVHTKVKNPIRYSSGKEILLGVAIVHEGLPPYIAYNWMPVSTP